MSLLQQIKTDQIQARKAKDSLKTKLLTTLLSEASKPGLDDGKRESTDPEVVAVIKKFIKNANETLSHCYDDDAVLEVSVLEAYLPQQLTAERLYEVLIQSGVSSVGEAMKFLKHNFNGQYDGREASTVAKELFS